MADQAAQTGVLDTAPEHVQESAESIADLHADHYLNIPTSQLGIEWITERIGRPMVIFFLIVLLAAWILSNYWAALHHRHALDAPPFYWLQFTVSVLAFLMTILILTTENRQNYLDERRAQLTLQLALLSEKKITKVIELVERIRQEHPLLSDPTDKETGAMMTPSNPKEVMDSLDQAQEAALKNSPS
jgi:uncharacterized membrane protein